MINVSERLLTAIIGKFDERRDDYAQAGCTEKGNCARCGLAGCVVIYERCSSSCC